MRSGPAKEVRLGARRWAGWLAWWG